MAEDLAPAETATLNRALVVGIITEAGGRTSHTAILAAQRASPPSSSSPHATAIPEGTPVAIDGDSGEVAINPDPEVVEAQQVRRDRRSRRSPTCAVPGAPADGRQVALLANIGGVEDAVASRGAGRRGGRAVPHRVRLPLRDRAPTVEEQTEIYRQVLEPFGGRSVVVRTLDAGADKPLAFADPAREENPALGRRGLRLSRSDPSCSTRSSRRSPRGA